MIALGAFLSGGIGAGLLVLADDGKPSFVNTISTGTALVAVFIGVLIAIYFGVVKGMQTTIDSRGELIDTLQNAINGPEGYREQLVAKDKILHDAELAWAAERADQAAKIAKLEAQPNLTQHREALEHISSAMQTIAASSARHDEATERLADRTSSIAEAMQAHEANAAQRSANETAALHELVAAVRRIAPARRATDDKPEPDR